MGSKHTIEPDRLTVALTSCGRFDLLETTLASFLAHFEAPRIFVSEDSERPEQAAAFACKHPEVEMCVNSAKLGQMRSIDALYASLRTPYVLHLEDDWFFTRGVPLDSVNGWADITWLSWVNRSTPRQSASVATPTGRPSSTTNSVLILRVFM